MASTSVKHQTYMEGNVANSMCTWPQVRLGFTWLWVFVKDMYDNKLRIQVCSRIAACFLLVFLSYTPFADISAMWWKAIPRQPQKRTAELYVLFGSRNKWPVQPIANTTSGIQWMHDWLPTPYMVKWIQLLAGHGIFLLWIRACQDKKPVKTS